MAFIVITAILPVNLLVLMVIGMVGRLRIPVLGELRVVVNVRVIEAIDVVVSIKGSRLFGSFVIVESDHLLVLGLRVPLQLATM